MALKGKPVERQGRKARCLSRFSDMTDLVARDHTLYVNLLKGMVINIREVFIMDFSYMVPGIKRKTGQVLKDIKKKELDNIYMLRDKLVAIGYNPGEVDYMIKTSSNGIKITKLDSQELQRLEAILQTQLSIAIQCIELVRETK